MMAKPEFLNESTFLSGIKAGFKITIKPFAGFWDMKYEKKGNIFSSSFILLMLIIFIALDDRYSGFIFNQNSIRELSVVNSIIGVIGPVLLWCIGSWCITTTLIEGEGKFSEIFMATGYALLPLTIATACHLVLTNILTLEESSIVSVVTAIGIIWTVLLIFSSTLSIHNLNLAQTIFTIIGTIVAAGIIIFIILLVFNLTEQLYSFVYGIIREITIRS